MCALFGLIKQVLNRLPRAFFQDGLIVEGPGIDLGGNGFIVIILLKTTILNILFPLCHSKHAIDTWVGNRVQR